MSAPFFSPAASACAVPALPPLTTRRAGALFLDDRGAATAEYAIATMAIVAGKRHIFQGRSTPRANV